MLDGSSDVELWYVWVCIFIFPVQHFRCNSRLRTLVFFPFWNILNVISPILFLGNSYYMYVETFYSLSILLKGSFLTGTSGILSKFLTAILKFTNFIFVSNLELILSIEIVISIIVFFYWKISNSFFSLYIYILPHFYLGFLSHL